MLVATREHAYYMSDLAKGRHGSLTEFCKYLMAFSSSACMPTHAGLEGHSKLAQFIDIILGGPADACDPCHSLSAGA